MIWFDYEQHYILAWLLGALVSLLCLFLAWRRRDIRAGMRFPLARLKGFGIRAGWRTRAVNIPFILRAMCIILIMIALARPQETQEESAEVEGIDIVVAFDLSGSMSSVDISDQDLIALQNKGEEPKDRFTIASEVIQDFIKSRQYDRVSLVIFGKDAFLQFPLTLDYGVMLNILRQMNLGDIDGKGTAIGNALAMALARLDESEAKTKLVILLTDGEDNGSNISPRQIATEAAKRQIPIFPILVGTEDQSRQPTGTIDLLTQMQRYQKVENPVNPKLLEDIAKETKGRFYRASDEDKLKEDFQDILDTFEKSRLVDYAVAERTERFPLFVWWAIACVLLELIISQLVLRRYP